MSRVRTFFIREAAECLQALQAATEEGLDGERAYRAARRFRGNAQMARFGDLARMAAALEARLRGAVEGSAIEGGAADAPSVDEVRAVARSLERGVEAVRDGRLVEDPRMEAEMEEQGSGGADDKLLVVAIDTLEYRGDAALERALALRRPLQDALNAAGDAAPILDELFDLIQLGTK